MMSDVPERIWAKDTDAVNGRNFIDTRTADINIASYSVEYVLASTIPAMIAEAVAREREACAIVADGQEITARERSKIADENEPEWDGGVIFGTELGARMIASTIRARKGDAS